MSHGIRASSRCPAPRRVLRSLGRLAAGALFVLALLSGSAPGQSAAPSAEVARTDDAMRPRLTWSGFSSTRYRVRWTGDETDEDLYQDIRLEGGDAEGLGVTGALYVRVHADLDEHGDSQGYDVFEDLWDTYDGRVRTRLYYGYADLHHLPRIDHARVGRQLLYDTPEVFRLDGAHVETEDLEDSWRVRLGAYGGIPVHEYESSSSGDLIVGGYVSSRPWTGGLLRIDATHIEDELDDRTEQDDLLGLAVEHRVSNGLGVALRHSRLDGESRDLEARVDWFVPEIGFRTQLRWYDQPTTRRAATTELDPFSSALQELAPHQLLSGVVHQDVGEHWTVSLGYTERVLDDQSDESSSNREFTRGFATLSWQDWPWEGAGGYVTADDWRSTGDDFRTLSGEFSQEFGETLEASVGSIYSLYDYDYLTAQERQQVRVYYVRLEIPVREASRLDLEYEYEKDEFDEYHGVFARWTVRF